MKKTRLSIIVVILLVFLICHPGSSINSEAIVRLKKAGFGDQTIQVIDREDRVKEAARILGAIGGTAGRGKKKVRGDSNYYRVLRYKGIEKQRKKHEKENN